MPSSTIASTIAQVQDSIRQKPSDDKLRVHLFQLYAQAGYWQKALAQLQVAAQLDDAHKMLAHAYRLALRAELLREDVFRGTRSPNILGQPLQWISYLVDALQADGKGEQERAAELRAWALDAAAPTPGRIDETPFEWITDADSRIGPVLEVFVNGDYYWVPFETISEIKLDAPVDLRDLVWVPAHLKLVNEGLHPVLLPARYPLLQANAEDALLQSRLTRWSALGKDDWQGSGVKILATDTDEASLLDARHIRLDSRALP
ncbi:Protein of avirulence locus involved in temperature-dependent protein secretion [Delftia tsuruhatensis]|uniref:type VI secretion system accessory protein TagJ n=1 Tax=Delftia tsuruhatensis TaxID=180282 RepID=UPI001E6EE714|nr:type VI secretion system accessory protein TagJ [Delftia tsuruhatensis]CAB5723859.1 Protein of avirulence locus involved in temperature-dependent protein secretion [Delftia tsuruhatensis]CAC9685052.1 Protein of avirulence locus involved in temperature-dependent protein secretion [Delftia tsuruhatensis]